MLFQKFQQFMYGRYGGDKFSLFLLVIALVISFAGAFFWPISLVADAIFIYVLFRMFSRNHACLLYTSSFVGENRESCSGWSSKRPPPSFPGSWVR